MRDVLKNLIDGMSEAWVKVGKYWRVPYKSAITQAGLLGATNGDKRNLGGVFKWATDCREAMVLVLMSQTAMKMQEIWSVPAVVLGQLPHSLKSD